MLKNYNLFRQRIGIFYVNRDWGEKVFDTVVNELPQEYIAKMYKTKDEMRCELKDGSVIIALEARENRRGCKFHKVIIQPEIDLDVWQRLIEPMIWYQNPRSFVAIDNENSKDINLVDAKYYYAKDYWEEDEDDISE